MTRTRPTKQDPIGPADAGALTPLDEWLALPKEQQEAEWGGLGAKKKSQLLFEALVRAYRWDLDLLTTDQRGALNQTEGKMRQMKVQVTPDDVLAFGEWWPVHDWRGKRAEAQSAQQQAQQAADAQRQAERAARQAEAENDPNLASARKVWDEACEQLSGSMVRGAYAAYIAPLEVLTPNGVFRLAVPNDEVLGWVENRLRSTIEQTLEGVKGRRVEVEFTVIGEQG